MDTLTVMETYDDLYQLNVKYTLILYFDSQAARKDNVDFFVGEKIFNRKDCN